MVQKCRKHDAKVAIWMQQLCTRVDGRGPHQCWTVWASPLWQTGVRRLRPLPPEQLPGIVVGTGFDPIFDFTEDPSNRIR